MAVDRALLLYLLQLAEPHGLLTDVKLHNLVFLCELQMFNKGVRGFHFEFFRYAYGVFSKDLDNDLLSLRRKERVENFSVTEKAEEALSLLEQVIEGNEANARATEILRAVAGHYAPMDTSGLTKAVEAIELSSPDQPELKLPIRTISFHTTLLVPSRIQVQSEFTLPAGVLPRLNAAMGY